MLSLHYLLFPVPLPLLSSSFTCPLRRSSPPHLPSLLQLSVSVDGLYSKKGTTAGPFSHLSSSRLHLGGADVPALLPGAETRSNFVGCMRKVSLCFFIPYFVYIYASLCFRFRLCQSVSLSVCQSVSLLWFQSHNILFLSLSVCLSLLQVFLDQGEGEREERREGLSSVCIYLWRLSSSLCSLVFQL